MCNHRVGLVFLGKGTILCQVGRQKTEKSDVKSGDVPASSRGRPLQRETGRTEGTGM